VFRILVAFVFSASSAISCFGQTNSPRPAQPTRIRNVEYRTHIPLPLRDKNETTRRLRDNTNDPDTPRGSDEVRDIAVEYARFLLQDLGYWKSSIDARLVLLRKKQGIRWVDVIVDIEEGPQYHLSSIEWTGMHVFTEAELQAVMPIHQGEVANRGRIADGLEAVRKLYGTRGYINFTCVPETEFNDAAHTLGLRIDVDEGGQFHFGELHLPGLDDVNKERLLRQWDSIKGTTYSWEKQDAFFESAMRPAGPRPRNRFHYLQYVNLHLDETERAVNFSISFLPPPDRKPVQ
jgi:hypothetical protein